MIASALDDYRLLGRSGLRVSPIALGGGSFGDQWGFGADKAESRRIFDYYVDLGGNFIDTANNYNGGASEAYLGEFLGAKRHRIVVTSKFTNSTDKSDPNSGGSHRKSIVRALEDSLQRLKTDYIDLYQVHVWEYRTPIEEIIRAQDDLVRAGKILYLGISNTPAWLVAQAQCLADRYGWSPFINLQIEYSLIERTAEHELLPMAAAMGIGVTAWSPTGGGILTGKYNSRSVLQNTNTGTPARATIVVPRLTERNFGIVNKTVQIAEQLAVPPIQVALRWIIDRSGVVAPIVGCRSQAQLEQSLGCLAVRLSPEHIATLTEVSQPPPIVPHNVLDSDSVTRMITGDVNIERRR